ncbi:MAG: DciA family protein [Formivibrio sp.]|nr:DciA family protein [Formivibrio sp.]
MPNPNFPTNFVGRDSQLSRIVQRVATLNQVLDVIRQAAPPELAPLCLGVAWHGSELLVALPFGAAAIRLRMAAPALIEALHKAGWHATAIRPKVQVALQRENSKQTKRLNISEPALGAFAELAQSVEDPDLRSALENLLRHHRRSSP